MPDGETNSTTDDSVNFQPTGFVPVERFMGLSQNDDQAAGSSTRTSEKDPRRIARKYQLELCKKALEENIIVYLGTGCGKTHIAILLIYEMSHLIRRSQKGICVFLAPTVALVQQQAKVIEDSTDFKVRVYCGGSKCLNTHYDWETEMEEYEVFVMTPEILLRNLHHCYIKMDFVELLIFDECHHAQVKSDHSYAEIMRVFYKANEPKRPRIFGMTASPVVGKGACNQQNLSRSINSLEKLLDAKVYSVEAREELDAFVLSPLVKIYYYGPVANGSSSSFMTYCCLLEDIKHKCILALGQMKCEHEVLLATKRLLCRMHKNIIFCLESLGVWGALQASKILLSGDNSEQSELIEAAEGNLKNDSLSDKYLNQAAEVFASGCKIDGGMSDMLNVDILEDPFFSKKLLRLIGILSSFRHRLNMKCIIFVNRIVIARSLSYILQNLNFLSYWKCDFLVGVHSKLRSMSRKTMSHILTKFQSGELNLLIATKVGEEGLDIQTCCLVIRFDLPETVSSFIQSRGRARMPQSEYAFLVDSGNEKELGLIDEFQKDENRMNREISSRSSNETFCSHEESIYRVVSTGASITSGRSISLLHEYCSKLPHDEYFDPKPKFFYYDDLEGTVCHAILPSNAPITQIVSGAQSSRDAAKKVACLKAVEELHKLGALNDYLLPMRDNADEKELELDSSDSDSSKDENSRRELHEMIFPAALKESWTGSEYLVLYCYHIKFTPHPRDRIYKEFGLFVKAPLPEEAERMDLELHLARRRSVRVNLMPSGVVELLEDEIIQAESFQEMFLKVILDRSEFVQEYIPLRNNDSRSISPTSYLLLPVTFHDNEESVIIDWRVIKRCLSSQIFQNHACSIVKEAASSYTHLTLYDGRRRSNDIENSLVYVPYKGEFFFVTNIVWGKNGYSQYKNSGSSSHFEHLRSKFGIHLKSPEQPLLCAKPLFFLHNLLHNRKQEDSDAHYLEEYFIDLPPELCQLKICGFSKDIGSSISLLPSIMHRLENLLVAIELKCRLAAAFPAGAEVTANRILEALTTEKCQERISLERLEILGDSFLKFAVARYLFLTHDKFDEGELTRRRSYLVKNFNLLKLATRKNLQVYIRDQPFEPSQFYLLGRPCPRICNEETRKDIHSHDDATNTRASETKCSKGHHWLQKKTISDVVEALVGAFLVDSGFKAAIAFLKWIGIQVEFESSLVTDALMASNNYVLLADRTDISAFQDSLGHQFLHKGLLLQALVHPSYHKHGGGCYQRLEFLGDAVLDYLITSYLYSAYPKLKPGQLTDLRSVFVRNEAFANVTVDRFFYKFLLCDSTSLLSDIKSYVDFIKSPSERDSLEQPRCPKALGDLVESSVGAVLVDTGFDMNYVWKIMLSFVDPIMSFSGFQLSPIRDLIEFCQNCGWKLEFNSSKMEGYYSVKAEVKGGNFHDTASAANRRKKDAEKIAANLILTKLKAKGFLPEVNSLEEILKSSSRMEPKLIGYDETPFGMVDQVDNGLETINGPEFSNADLNPRVHREVDNSHPVHITRISRTPVSSSVAAGEQLKPSMALEGHDSPADLQSSSGWSGKTTARSRLYEICAANHWNRPSFDCMNEEGPSHLKMFTYKVVLEMEEAPDTIFEFVGAPHLRKKAAAEHAAEAALWYLKKAGYLPETDC
ncbi:dicer-like protein 4 isoform X2 [Benincasa hispida]|uniref:dicer-like protein 4 isoform X2 n=1 Tax=Benincasa hispida TaxID=102211 RepID=UPI0018FF563D|nr:dicer-like protein 4 isoform X2 [Benincasa hispida]